MRGCDAVVHFAAESHVDRSIYEPAPVIETNVNGTFVLLQVARKLGIDRFVHISTDEVYGDMAPGAFAERKFAAAARAAPIPPRKPVPICWFSPTCAPMDFPALITRSSNNYGPYQFPEKFLPLMITNALDDKPLPIYGDGKQQRDWLHVEDNCRGILAVLERGRIGEVYNIGGLDIEENLTMAQRLLRADRQAGNAALLCEGPSGPRPPLCPGLRKNGERTWLETGDPARRRFAADHRLVQGQSEWMAGVRGGEYLSYYEKYYENRDPSLHAIPHERRRTLQNSVLTVGRS